MAIRSEVVNAPEVNVKSRTSSTDPANDGGPTPFPGCDPVAMSCGDGMTCEVRCATKMAACTAGGTGFHGTTCTSSADCAGGAECVDYAAAGCAE